MSKFFISWAAKQRYIDHIQEDINQYYFRRKINPNQKWKNLKFIFVHMLW